MTEEKRPIRREGQGLSRLEFEEVMRRATELAANDPGEGASDVSEAELYRIASEVGLSEEHVRRALGEVRTGALPSLVDEGENTFLDRMFGPALVQARRVVPGTPDTLVPKLDEYLVAGRLLQRVRRGPSFMQYRPAVDWMSQIGRAASGTARKYYIASAKSVEIRLDPVDEKNTLVEITVDPGTRSEHALGTFIGGGMGGLGLGGGAIGIAVGTGLPLIAGLGIGAVVAGGFFTGLSALVKREYRKTYTHVHSEVEGLLDLLEMEEDLQPPPPSWRKWVERQFHGARRLIDPDGDGSYGM